MKKYILPLIATGALFSLSAKAETIFDAMSEAYRTNPDLQAQRAYLRSVDENVAIAKSGYRPSVSLTGQYSDSNKDNKDYSAEEGGVSTSLGAQINQPLFSGFSTVNSVKAADSEVRSEQYNLSDYEQEILLNVSEAYLNVVRDQAIVGLQKNNEKLLKKQLEETQERYRVGELTRTDVAQAKSSHAEAVANRIEAEGNLEVSKAIYKQVIGKNPQDLSEPDNIHKFLPPSFEKALQYTMDNNFALLQAKEALKSKEYTVKANYGALSPQLSAVGSAAKNRNNPKHYGDPTSNVDEYSWGLNATIPLYDAGEDRARIRKSKYAKWQAQEGVLSARRAAVSSITSSWEAMTSYDAKIKALEEQVDANKIALNGVKKEEALGNRTVLDVLDAYQTLLNSQVDVVKARRQYYLSAMQVMQAMGKLTAKNMKLNVDLYDAKQHYKDTRNKWLSTSID
ncbi:MAG: TolC family outer membrane protein [Alphaproteobacteria bacterium]|nr:TolC family outer membrane protein [Alphaproteobacteria bacterium]